MECLTTHAPDKAVPAKAEELGRLQRWVRNALLATLPLFGGDSVQVQTSTERADASARVTLLANTLERPEQLHAYCKEHLRYIPEERGKDHWQSPEETVQKGGGDCEDFALFGQKILQHQRKLAHVLALPRHAVCVWIEQRTDEKYNIYTLDENGVDKNGRWEQGIRSPYDSVPREPQGFETMTEALNTALHQFDDGNGGACAVHPYWIPIVRKIGPLQSVDIITIHAFDPDAPLPLRLSGLELVVLTALLEKAYKTYRLLRRRREGAKETWKGYFTTFRLH